MADSPSSILLLRLQSTGSNTNLWGGYLNTALQTQERASKGYQAYAVTGDATISWTNYSAANDLSVGFVKLTGSLSTSATLTAPSYQNVQDIWNAAGQSITVKCSGGTGVTIPNGMRTRIYCDGTDYYSSASNWLNSYASTLTNAGDIVVKTTLETAIANATFPATAGTVLVSAADTTAGYVGAKVTVAGSGAATVSASTTNPGANEVKVWTVAVGSLGLALQSEQTAGFSPTAGKIYPVNIASTGTLTFPASASNGDVIGILNYGAGTITLNWGGLKYYGSTTALATNTQGLGLFQYTNAATGWVDL